MYLYIEIKNNNNKLLKNERYILYYKCYDYFLKENTLLKPRFALARCSCNFNSWTKNSDDNKIAYNFVIIVARIVLLKFAQH